MAKSGERLTAIAVCGGLFARRKLLSVRPVIYGTLTERRKCLLAEFRRYSACKSIPRYKLPDSSGTRVAGVQGDFSPAGRREVRRKKLSLSLNDVPRLDHPSPTPSPRQPQRVLRGSR